MRDVKITVTDSSANLSVVIKLLSELFIEQKKADAATSTNKTKTIFIIDEN